MLTGEALAARLARHLSHFGETITIAPQNGGAAQTVWAKVAVLSFSVRRDRFLASETANWQSPCYSVTVAGATTALPGDTITLIGRGDYVLRKTDPYRVGNVVVRTVLYVARSG